jgi:hypothetical protein
VAKRSKCCVRRKRGRDGRMHCAKWKPPHQGGCKKKGSAPTGRRRKRKARSGGARGHTRGGIGHAISVASRMRCSNPKREAKLQAIGHFIVQAGQVEASPLSVFVQGRQRATRHVRSLQRQFKAAGRAARKCRSGSTALART